MEADAPEIDFHFDLNAFLSPDFTFEKTVNLVHTSLQTYEDDAAGVRTRFDDLDVTLPQLPGELDNPFSIETTQGIALETEQTLILAFRGSKGKEDWKQNFKIKLIKAWFKIPGRVHRGFYQCLQQVWEPVVVPLVKKSQETGKPILLTGHSLGGAICSLAAARIAKTYGEERIAGVYTFGQPRAGNLAFSKYIDKVLAGRYYRFVNYRDIVPCIPPAPYCHVGKRFDINRDQTVEERTGRTLPRQLSREEFESFKEHILEGGPPVPPRIRGEKPEGIENHSLFRYAAALVRQIVEKK